MSSNARRPYSQPAFVVAAVSLLVAAIGLNGAVAGMKLHFKKLPVPLQRDLPLIPRQMGNWYQVSLDEPLDHDVQEVLGTDEYIFRDYVDLSAHAGQCGADLIAALEKDNPDQAAALRTKYLSQDAPGRVRMLGTELRDKSAAQRKGAIARVQGQWPDSIVNIAVTYYTGLVDTVAHIPERCYVADGYEPTSTPETPNWPLANSRRMTVRFIHFEDQSGAARISRNVAYFFQVNGRYEDNPEGVRFRLQNLFAKYGYYAKVEMMTLDPDSQRSTGTMAAFLGAALPELEKTFPDWSKLQ